MTLFIHSSALKCFGIIPDNFIIKVKMPQQATRLVIHISSKIPAKEQSISPNTILLLPHLSSCPHTQPKKKISENKAINKHREREWQTDISNFILSYFQKQIIYSGSSNSIISSVLGVFTYNQILKAFIVYFSSNLLVQKGNNGRLQGASNSSILPPIVKHYMTRNLNTYS